MIKEPNNFPVQIKYDQTITLKNYARYRVQWESKGYTFLTCGEKENKIECVELIPQSIKIENLANPGQYIPLEHFNQVNPNEILDLASNCHGFTFSYGKFFINTRFVPLILEVEYIEVQDDKAINEGNFDVLVLFDKNGEAVHSARYQYELFLHKEGTRNYSACKDVKDILNISEYQDCSARYYKKANRSCSGFCINSVTEPYTPLFKNQE